MSNVLDDIVVHKRGEIAAAKQRLPEAELRRQLADAPRVRDFVAALRASDDVALIAEVKKASPSAGIIRSDFDPVSIAKIYERHGAACVSVLTDERFFQGHIDFLRDVRAAISLPVLRKDFILDRYQVLEARAAGADCVLLIAECLDDRELHDLFDAAAEMGMSSLIEIYRPENLARVLSLNPPLLGINNRNLKTNQIDLSHSIRLREQVPAETLLVSESGIRSRDDVDRLQQAGIQAMLVGEMLMRPADIGSAVDELLGKSGS
ncbi:MAG: indole-3-glycerol phosphate synthase TrpC [Planctomycetes bacterium]|nr:indole-3-glycerol phosphate synthase TrpC [Planctomycetota bacterium]